MKDTLKYIRLGFYDNFKGYDTLLISVDINGLLEIENAFLKLSNGIESFDFSTLSLLDTKYKVGVKAYNDTNNYGLTKIDTGKFEWRLTSYLWNQFREMTTELCHNGNGGHHFLDFESNYFNKEENYIDVDSLQVVLSLDEYPLSFWQEHFTRCNS